MVLTTIFNNPPAGPNPEWAGDLKGYDMEFKKGQFGYISDRNPANQGFGWFDGTFIENTGIKHVASTDRHFTSLLIKGDTFTPFNEPLPLDCTFKEWATFMMGQMPDIKAIAINEALEQIGDK